jgi:hypothetical protein
METTLRELAAGDRPESRGAAALIEAGFPAETETRDLTSGSVTRTLAETLARELAAVYEQLGETYQSAFLDTATGDSVAILVDRLGPSRPWWCRWFRARR